MEAAVGIVGKNVKINAVSDVKEAKFEFGTIDVYDMKLVDMDKLERGVVSVQERQKEAGRDNAGRRS